MGKPRASRVVTSVDLANELRATSSKGVDTTVRFANEDVPQFLKNLRRFEAKSRKVKVLVK